MPLQHQSYHTSKRFLDGAGSYQGTCTLPTNGSPWKVCGKQMQRSVEGSSVGDSGYELGDHRDYKGPQLIWFWDLIWSTSSPYSIL